MRGWTVLGLTLWVVLLRLPLLFVDTLGWDEGFYLVVATRLMDGGHLYVDVWDYKPIGIYLIYAAFLLLFGKSVTAITIGSALAVLATTLLLEAIGRRVFGRPRAGLYAAIVFPVCMLVLQGNSANAENFFIICGAISMLLLGCHLARPADMAAHRRAAFLFGLVQGIALQIKLLTVFETAFLGLVFAGVIWAERRRLLDLAELCGSFLAGYLLPTLVAFGYFWSIGAFDEMVLATFVSPKGYGTRTFGLHDPFGSLWQIYLTARPYGPLLVVGCLALAAAMASGLRSPGRRLVPYWLVLAWLLGAFASSTFTGYFFGHYFIVFAAPLSLLAALGIDRFGDSRMARVARVGVAVLVMAAPLYFYQGDLRRRLADPLYDRAEAIAAEVRRLVAPGTRIFALNIDPEVYFLSDTIPATRFAFSWQISRESLVPLGIDAPAEIRLLFERKPALVVASRAYMSGPPTGLAGIYRHFIERDYEPVEISNAKLRGDVSIFRRRADSR